MCEEQQRSTIHYIKDHEFYADGWWWEDETQGLNGPCATRKEAEAEQKKYCDEFLR